MFTRQWELGVEPGRQYLKCLCEIKRRHPRYRVSAVTTHDYKSASVIGD